MLTDTGPRPTTMRLLALLVSAMLTWSASAAAAPNETLVSPQTDMLDVEYSQSRAELTWTDSTGNLWIASVDRNTGMFDPPDGKGLLIDADAMTAEDLRVIGNGPEWLVTANLDQIVYTKFLPGKPHTRANARLAIAAQKYDGTWGLGFLSDQPRNAPYASQDAGDPTTRITYVDPLGNHYWREVQDATTESLVGAYPRSYYSMRHVQGQRAVVFFAPSASGQRQVFRFWPDTGDQEQITGNLGHGNTTNVPWMWSAPEFDGDYVMAALATNDTELRIYRRVNPSRPYWSVIYSVTAPDNGTFGSPEPFVHNGRSYVFIHATVGRQVNPSRIFLSNIDAANPMLRQLTPDQPDRTRRDPEVFITSLGPMIYFNRLVKSTNPWCPSCSEGIYMSDTGLGAPLP